jgi:ribulose-5-phosphate 4-epimerase/fuculose-1-phosphate aldolase
MAREGVIRFDLQFTAGAPLAFETIRSLNAWRRILWQLELIGRDLQRYSGDAYGNVSQRLAPLEAPVGARRFVISGTQTGGLAKLTASGYSIVSHYEPEANCVVATGPVKPSSESLTHAMLYDLDAGIHAVLHVHSPDIWGQSGALGLASSAATVSYGTPAMAQEVARLFRETGVREQGIFSMGGHQDGIIAFGDSPDQAGRRLLEVLVKSYAAQGSMV